MTVYGVTGHAATPWKGINAIEGMARVITALREELWPILARRNHQYFPQSTATISTIAGGVKTNVIPDRCDIYVDRRIIPGETPEAVAAEILEIAERAIAAVPGYAWKCRSRAAVAWRSWPIPSRRSAARCKPPRVTWAKRSP